MHLIENTICVIIASTATPPPRRAIDFSLPESRQLVRSCTETRIVIVSCSEKTIVSMNSSVSLRSSPRPLPRQRAHRLTTSWTTVIPKRANATRDMRMSVMTRKVPPLASNRAFASSLNAWKKHSGLLPPKLSRSIASVSVTTSTLLGQPSLSRPMSESVCPWLTRMMVELTHFFTPAGSRTISRM